MNFSNAELMYKKQLSKPDWSYCSLNLINGLANICSNCRHQAFVRTDNEIHDALWGDFLLIVVVPIYYYSRIGGFLI